MDQTQWRFLETWIRGKDNNHLYTNSEVLVLSTSLTFSLLLCCSLVQFTKEVKVSQGDLVPFIKSPVCSTSPVWHPSSPSLSENKGKYIHTVGRYAGILFQDHLFLLCVGRDTPSSSVFMWRGGWCTFLSLFFLSFPLFLTNRRIVKGGLYLYLEASSLGT